MLFEEQKWILKYPQLFPLSHNATDSEFQISFHSSQVRPNFNMDLELPKEYDLSCLSDDMFDEEQLFEGLTQAEREDEARQVCAQILLDLVNLVVVRII